MKHLLAAIAIITLLGCQENREGYSLQGEINDVEDGKMIYVSELDENNQPKIKDSVVVQDEKFNLNLPEVDQPNLHFLTMDGYNGNVMFISENEPIEFEIYKDSLQTSKVTGGKENEVFYSYLHHLKDLNQQVMEMRTSMQQQASGNMDPELIAEFQEREKEIMENDLEYKKEIVQENPDAFASILVLSDMMNMGAPANEIKELYESLSENVKQTSLAQTFKENLDKMSSVEIGAKAPDFSGPNPEGEEIALSEELGKVTLIDFWAAWCKPCRVENPNIVNVFNKYHDDGFNIIGVSLDREGQKDRWVQAIEDDNLTWPQVSHLQFWEEPIAQAYGVRAIPAQFLLDENGVIVATNLRGDDLEAKVKEFLKK